MGLGYGIRDLGSGKNLFWITDPGVKKTPYPGSGSATLVRLSSHLRANLPSPTFLGASCMNLYHIPYKEINPSAAPCRYLGLRVAVPHRLNNEGRSPKFIWAPCLVMCTAVPTHWLRPPLTPHLDLYTRALLVSKDRRHLFLTPLL
jgi:hypothetical protein